MMKLHLSVIGKSFEKMEEDIAVRVRFYIQLIRVLTSSKFGDKIPESYNHAFVHDWREV